MKYQLNIEGAIKTVMSEYGLTQAQMAVECHIAPATLWSWLKGRTQPTLKQIIWLCDYYGMEISEWVKEVNIKNQWR